MPNYIDFKQRKLSSLEVVFVGAQNAGDQIDPAMLQAQVTGELRSGHSLGVRMGNTLFLVITPPEHKDAGVFQVFNADTPQNFIGNCVGFIKLMQQNGYQTLIVHYQDPKISRVVQMAYNQGLPQFDPSTKIDVQQGDQGNFQCVIYTNQSHVLKEAA